MKTGRRYFLANFIVTLAAARTLSAQGQRPVPRAPGQPFPSPRGTDTSPDDVPLPHAADPEAQLKESQKTLRRDADHLLQLAQELKDQAYDTEQTKVLPLSLVHKAEEVEKLAKQIKDLVRAA
jgi:hypothetical protein